MMKHFIVNNQETMRSFVDAKVSQKALWEVYYPPFIAAMEAGGEPAGHKVGARLFGSSSSTNSLGGLVIYRKRGKIAAVDDHEDRTLLAVTSCGR